MLVEADAAQEAIGARGAAAHRPGECPSPLLYFQVGEMVVRFTAKRAKWGCDKQSFG
jgi:hypothetical protein